MRIRNTGLLFDDQAQSTPGYMLICPVEGNRAILLDPVCSRTSVVSIVKGLR